MRLKEKGKDMPLRASIYRLVILGSLVLAAGAGWKWG